jgi:hypothetical protein
MAFSFVPPPANGQQAHDVCADIDAKVGKYSDPLTPVDEEAMLGLSALPKGPMPVPFSVGAKPDRNGG